MAKCLAHSRQLVQQVRNIWRLKDYFPPQLVMTITTKKVTTNNEKQTYSSTLRVCWQNFDNHMSFIPSGKLAYLWKITVFIGKSTITVPFSIAIWVYQKVVRPCKVSEPILDTLKQNLSWRKYIIPLIPKDITGLDYPWYLKRLS